MAEVVVIITKETTGEEIFNILKEMDKKVKFNPNNNIFEKLSELYFAEHIERDIQLALDTDEYNLSDELDDFLKHNPSLTMNDLVNYVMQQMDMSDYEEQVSDLIANFIGE